GRRRALRRLLVLPPLRRGGTAPPVAPPARPRHSSGGLVDLPRLDANCERVSTRDADGGARSTVAGVAPGTRPVVGRARHGARRGPRPAPPRHALRRRDMA